MTRAFNMDCMEAMKQFPDKYFDLAVVDPPYGISITARHRERERDEIGRRCSSSVRRYAEVSEQGGQRSRTGVQLARVQGPNKNSKCHQNFMSCSMTVPHRTQSILGNCKG